MYFILFLIFCQDDRVSDIQLHQLKEDLKGVIIKVNLKANQQREFDILLIEYQMKQEGVNLSLVNYQRDLNII
jgi:hypothetical protein